MATAGLRAPSRKNQTPRQTVHQRVAATLELWIRKDLQVGEKLPSEAKLAVEHGVSTLTIREAVASLVQKGLVERRHGSGTYVKDINALRHVGILLNLDLGGCKVSGFWLPLAAQSKRLLELAGYRARLYSSSEYVDELHEDWACADLEADLEDELLLGLLVLGNYLTAEQNALLRARSIPTVGDAPDMGIQVKTDYPAMVEQGVAGLVERGCRRVAILRWGIDQPSCQLILSQHGLPDDDALVVSVPHPTEFGVGYRLTRDLLASAGAPIDGLLLTDEVMLPDATFALLEAGLRVPEDLRIMTHANEGAKIFSPLPVTALVVSPTRMAEDMVNMISRMINGERVSTHPITNHISLVERPGGLPPG